MDVPTLTPSRIIVAMLLPGLVIVMGAAALWSLTDGAYSWGELLYFALITVTTVGFGEPDGLATHPGAHWAVAALLVAGVVTLALFQSALTALIVQRVVVSALWRRRMQKKISQLSGHAIIVGAGRTGHFAMREYVARGEPMVAVDIRESVLQALNDELGGKLLYVVGDATHDSTLIAAGVEQAGGLITAMSDERDNLFVTVSFRALNKTGRIVSKSLEVHNEAKLRHAGANAVVSPHRIGGHRLVGEYAEPTVTEFLDQILTGAATLRFEQVAIGPTASCIGKLISELRIHEETNAFVIAVRLPSGTFVYNPSGSERLVAGSVLVVLGEPDCRRRLRSLLGTD